MKRQNNETPISLLPNRRGFLGMAGASTLAALTPAAHAATTESPMSNPVFQTGNGLWTYRLVNGWGKLPAGTDFGGTHGGIAIDKAGHVYISTQSATGILVYDEQGKLLRTIAHEYPEVHSIFYAQENGVEYLYTTVQTGTPKENWLFVKMKTDGTVVQKITAPPEAGFKAPNEWRLTAAVPAPNGDIIIANGYGDSRIFIFDKHGNYKSAFAGKGTEDGKCDCSHGLSVDTRYGQPMLLVCDRANLRLSHFDFDGKFVGHVTHHLRLPCQVSFNGDYALVSELLGRATILDKDNVPVAFLGDDPIVSQRGAYDLNPASIAPAILSAPHGCYFAPNGDVYVSDWNRVGRVSKFEKV